MGYAFTLCLFAAASSFPFFLRFWKHDSGAGIAKLHVMFLFFVSIMFAVSLASLFFYHIFLTLKNRSTLEAFRPPIFRHGPDRRAYDLGRRENWREVFGSSFFSWFFPVSSRFVLLLTSPRVRPRALMSFSFFLLSSSFLPAFLSRSLGDGLRYQMRETRALDAVLAESGGFPSRLQAQPSEDGTGHPVMLECTSPVQAVANGHS